ncbi:hypothetical protein GW932_03115 [archaeon]|nr:hypothetical protein [archaeon]
MAYIKIENVLLVYSRKSAMNNSFDLLNNLLKNKKISFSSILIDNLKSNDLKERDLIIVFGGDGTFIRTSHFLQNELILGINSDSSTSEGGLMLLDENNLEKLNEIFEDKYSILNRRRIDIYLNGKLIKEKALNEVYFGALNQFHTSRYDLILGEEIEEQRSSGVLVVTCTGSSAWYKSAGGKSFIDRDSLHYLVREPFISRLFNPNLIQGKILKEIKFISKMYHESVVSLDSNLSYPVNYGEEVLMKLSEQGLNCVSFL